ncbi:conserved hypothetical protein [delta proteobacterium NaphS2]|nr:conserved hypothetical protein [delta proteobacterium NaphS2]
MELYPGVVLDGVPLKERLLLKDLPPPLLLASEYSTQTAETKTNVTKSIIIETNTCLFESIRHCTDFILPPFRIVPSRYLKSHLH